ncbi:hypothetical protein DSO57_1018032 [Entomophthora muscae]|uniref:Uncharacterized protein n=1 Tax=Entomophthora muscae TaxID=34485 RepID=A0ACC2URE6_9FUNG|nr:hypothetical protein DSO57_1018032 [Entomophthora muscae]
MLLGLLLVGLAASQEGASMQRQTKTSNKAGGKNHKMNFVLECKAGAMCREVKHALKKHKVFMNNAITLKRSINVHVRVASFCVLFKKCGDSREIGNLCNCKA